MKIFSSAKEIFRESSWTLRANIIGQIIGAAATLMLPNLLVRDEYAKVVFIGFLMSFGVFYDFGASAVYARLAPTMLKNRMLRLRLIEMTVIKISFCNAIIYALVVAMVYDLRYGNATDAFVIFIYALIPLWLSFLMARAIVHGRYHYYYSNVKFQSIVKLLQIPFAYYFGFIGWLYYSAISGILLLVKMYEPKIVNKCYSSSFVKAHLGEGIALSIKTLIWIQLLCFPRTYSVIHLSDNEIASYGLVNTIFQMIFSTALAIFVPITRMTYIKFSESQEDGYSYVRKVLILTTPIFIFMALVLIVFGHEVVRAVYKNLLIEDVLLNGCFVTVPVLPLFFMMGNILAAKKLDNHMSAIMLLWYAAGWMIAENAVLRELAFPIIIYGATLTLAYSVSRVKRSV